jgi:predicted transglutaminase-like cysteine proteinase
MRRLGSSLAALTIALTVAGPTAAGASETTTERAMRSATPAHLPEGRPMLAPMGYIVFCVQNRAACMPSAGTDQVQLTGSRRSELFQVNRSVNRAITPRLDVGRGYSADKWDLEPATGDCKDFALTKRQRLVANGWPARSLRLATAQTASGEGHTVLVVRTDSGDVVLDNRRDSIMDWQSAGLWFVGIQSARNPKLWNRVAPGMPRIVAAAD